MHQIRKAIALSASSFLLVNCATHSSPDVAPQRPPAAVCAPAAAEPKLPDGAGIPQPVTDAERLAMDTFLGWDAQEVDWGRALAKRAQATVAWCSKSP